MGTSQQKGRVDVDMTDSEVGQLNAAGTIEQHYHVSPPAPEFPSLADLDRAYQTSQEAVRVAKFWNSAYSLIWIAVTVAMWMCMPKSLPSTAGPIDHFVYLIYSCHCSVRCQGFPAPGIEGAPRRVAACDQGGNPLPCRVSSFDCTGEGSAQAFRIDIKKPPGWCRRLFKVSAPSILRSNRPHP